MALRVTTRVILKSDGKLSTHFDVVNGNKLASAKRYEWLLAAAKRSYAVEDLPDTIIEAVRSAKMDKRHNPLNKPMRAS